MLWSTEPSYIVRGKCTKYTVKKKKNSLRQDVAGVHAAKKETGKET